MNICILRWHLERGGGGGIGKLWQKDYENTVRHNFSKRRENAWLVGAKFAHGDLDIGSRGLLKVILEIKWLREAKRC